MGKVYDLTTFAKGHVGGVAPIARLAGKDGTASFIAAHGKNVLNVLSSECCIGEFEMINAMPAANAPIERAATGGAAAGANNEKASMRQGGIGQKRDSSGTVMLEQVDTHNDHEDHLVRS